MFNIANIILYSGDKACLHGSCWWAKGIGGRAILKCATQKQNEIFKTRELNAIALLNYLKRIAPQQLC
jgi:hypothetical protein